MSENSKIEWTDHTFNPWEGCQKVGPGCDHCYAETRNARFAGGTAINWGVGAPRRRTSASNWNKPIQWNKQADQFFALHGRRQRVFCASLADVFDKHVDSAWRDDLWQLIWDTPNLDWLLLTKRIGNVVGMLPDEWGNGKTKYWPNVWIGATVCNQEEADRDIPKLLRTRALNRFLSVEPLLSAIDLSRWLDIIQYEDGAPWGRRNIGHLHDMLDWVIVGGESGTGARPMHPNWVREIRDQCNAADVPFLFKQWGEYLPFKGTPSQWPNIIAPRFTFDDCQDMQRVGKRIAGRLLDGREWNEYPEKAVA